MGGHYWQDISSTLCSDTGDNRQVVVYDARGNGDGRIANAITGDHENRVTDYTKLAISPLCAFGISSYNSNSMLSDNPTSGIYEASISRTLDTSVPCPNKNAGGMAVVLCIEGNGQRPSHKGSGIKDDTAFSLNTVEHHAVCCPENPTYAMTTGSYAHVCKERSPCLQARDYKDAPLVSKCEYVIRRLTPQECALLQGFPIDWCTGLENKSPSEVEIEYWHDVWETHRKAVGKAKKSKSRNQLIKWLKNPYSDSNEYRLWGNGVALPCVIFVLGGIMYYEQKYPMCHP